MGGFVDKRVKVAMVIGLGVGAFTYRFLKLFEGTTPETRVSAADRTQWITTEPPAVMALLFVERNWPLGLLGFGIEVLLDGVLLAQLRTPRFTAAVITPGPHTLTAVGTTGRLDRLRPTHVAFTAMPGERVVFTMGWGGVVDLKRVEATPAYLEHLQGVTMVARGPS